MARIGEVDLRNYILLLLIISSLSLEQYMLITRSITRLRLLVYPLLELFFLEIEYNSQCLTLVDSELQRDDCSTSDVRYRNASRTK